LDGFDDGYVGHDDDDDDDDDFGHEPDAGGRREPESGPMPVITIGPPVQYSPVSMWAMPDTGTPESEVPAEAPAPAPPAEVEADFQEDPDSVDTAPTQIPSEPEPDHDEEDEPDAGPASGRHSAIIIDEPAPAETSLRLATEDPFHAPDGYPIKADTKSGLYWLPGNGRYDHARAEIWFASEEFALTNGFVRG
jgi:hypothetical protein